MRSSRLNRVWRCRSTHVTTNTPLPPRRAQRPRTAPIWYRVRQSPRVTPDSRVAIGCIYSSSAQKAPPPGFSRAQARSSVAKLPVPRTSPIFLASRTLSSENTSRRLFVPVVWPRPSCLGAKKTRLWCHTGRKTPMEASVQ